MDPNQSIQKKKPKIRKTSCDGTRTSTMKLITIISFAHKTTPKNHAARKAARAEKSYEEPDALATAPVQFYKTASRETPRLYTAVNLTTKNIFLGRLVFSPSASLRSSQ